MKLSVIFVATLAAVVVCLSQGMPHGNGEAGNNGNGPAKDPPKPHPNEMAIQNKLKAFVSTDFHLFFSVKLKRDFTIRVVVHKSVDTSFIKLLQTKERTESYS